MTTLSDLIKKMRDDFSEIIKEKEKIQGVEKQLHLAKAYLKKFEGQDTQFKLDLDPNEDQDSSSWHKELARIRNDFDTSIIPLVSKYNHKTDGKKSFCFALLYWQYLSLILLFKKQNSSSLSQLFSTTLTNEPDIITNHSELTKTLLVCLKNNELNFTNEEIIQFYTVLKNGYLKQDKYSEVDNQLVLRTLIAEPINNEDSFNKVLDRYEYIIEHSLGGEIVQKYKEALYTALNKNFLTDDEKQAGFKRLRLVANKTQATAEAHYCHFKIMKLAPKKTVDRLESNNFEGINDLFGKINDYADNSLTLFKERKVYWENRKNELTLLQKTLDCEQNDDSVNASNTISKQETSTSDFLLTNLNRYQQIKNKISTYSEKALGNLKTTVKSEIKIVKQEIDDMQNRIVQFEHLKQTLEEIQKYLKTQWFAFDKKRGVADLLKNMNNKQNMKDDLLQQYIDEAITLLSVKRFGFSESTTITKFNELFKKQTVTLFKTSQNTVNVESIIKNALEDEKKEDQKKEKERETELYNEMISSWTKGSDELNQTPREQNTNNQGNSVGLEYYYSMGNN